MRLRDKVCLCVTGILLASCGTQPIKPSTQHFQQPTTQSNIDSVPPLPITDSVMLPPPKPASAVATYSVVVTNVTAQEILFALARDAKINLDIHSGIQGTVTINAINQTLPQILTRIARQVDMRYELNSGTLTVMPDTPYLYSYKIDYVNMSRDTKGEISNATQVGSNSSGSATGSGSSGSNNSSLTITNISKNHFWDILIQNIKDILRETDRDFIVYGRNCGASANSIQVNKLEASASGTGKAGVTKDSVIVGTGTSGEGDQKATGNSASGQKGEARGDCKDYMTDQKATVIANPENGLITVRATGKQHEKIQEFIDQIMTNARRQVLIEATIVEVRLSDNYQQGIDWSRFALGTKGFDLQQTGTGGLLAANKGSMFTLGYFNPTSKFGDLAASISLLESFGNVKVLSSPKLSVMNNQTAILRVVNNLVYFVINATTTAPTSTSSAFSTYSTTPNTVPIGFTMSVTPQINDSDTVLLNVRPSISRLLYYVNDPNPSLATAGVVSQIPVTSIREMESVLKIENNQTAVLGGLMEDRMDKNTDEVPGLASIPLLGNLFKNRNDTTEKTELVIFLRPTVIKNASIDADFRGFGDFLPGQDFFEESARGKR